ncbi:MAG: hypothetical protein Q8918_08470 [Bacteroidota bacterium]|nr:hypothetical protein [Bacteroidota bacterium]
MTCITGSLGSEGVYAFFRQPFSGNRKGRVTERPVLVFVEYSKRVWRLNFGEAGCNAPWGKVPAATVTADPAATVQELKKQNER